MKNALERARAEIDRIDTEMARLFSERMQAAKQIAAYKQETGMRLFDPQREAQVIEKGAARVEDAVVRSYYVNFLHALMDLSKAYQGRLSEGMRVAFSGTTGAFAEVASRKIFPDAALCPFPDFEAAYRAVEEGRCDVAVLPLENSTNGAVGTVMDLAFFGSLSLNGIYDVEIEQNLLAKPGTPLSAIRTVISHPQALGQCAAFLKENSFVGREAVNTALAAEEVAKSQDDSLAAIGSREAAEAFGLEILRGHIHEKGGNTTRFAVFSRTALAKEEPKGYFVMTFTVKNEAGALAKAISAIGEGGFNLRAIKSRPTKKISWDYYFFCECEGNPESAEGKAMLEKLGESCDDLKVLGAWEKEIVL